jgi:hypothetical protein
MVAVWMHRCLPMALNELMLNVSPRIYEFVLDIGAFENHELMFADGFDFVQ